MSQALTEHLKKIGQTWNEYWEGPYPDKKEIIAGRKLLRCRCFQNFPKEHHDILRRIFDQNEHGHYLSMSIDRKNRCSFNPSPGRIHRWDSRRRRVIGLMSYIRKYFDLDVPESRLELWCKMSLTGGQFERLYGDDLVNAYIDCTGTSSCMTGEERNLNGVHYTDIYGQNPEICSLLTYQDGLGSGRALLWEVDGDLLMDRIYTQSNHVIKRFHVWAKQNKAKIRLHNGAPDSDYNFFEGEKVYEVTLEHNKVFPYADSFWFIKSWTSSTITLSNSSRGQIGQMSDCYGRHSAMQVCENCDTYGVFEELDGHTFCEDCSCVDQCQFCGDEVYTNASTELNGESACSSCASDASYCESCEAYVVECECEVPV